MKIAVLIARILLGIVFLVFGLNGFLHFIPMAPPPGVAGQFLGALVASHLVVPIFAVQVLGGILLLLNRYVPLALTILGPIIFNIFFFHLLVAPSGLPLAILVILLWIVIFWRLRSHFSGLFTASGT